MNEICTVCRKKHDVLLPQWWSLTNYYGVKGIFCYTCFEKVRHKDARPIHPIAFKNLLRKMDSATTQAHSKTEYKRLVAQGANVLPPTPTTCNVNDDGVSDSVNEGNVLAGDALDAAIDAEMEKNT